MAGKQKYTPEEISNVLRIMDENNGSVMAAHRKTGISRATLTRCKEKHYQGIAIRANKRVEEKITKTYENIHEAVLIEEGKLEKRAIKAKEAIINRIIELVPNEKNIDRLSNALKTMHTIATGEDPDKPKGGGNTLNIYQEVQQLLIQQNGNSKD
jgi:hypothetical protein